MALPSTITPPDRRQRFKSFMRRFNPSASPITAIDDGLIHEQQERSVFRNLATGADLSPGSQRLVVGGIGSGKSTELLLAQRELAKQTEIMPVYIDVSAETDLSELNSGALLASLGLRLCANLDGHYLREELRNAHDAIKKAAYGYLEALTPPRPPRLGERPALLNRVVPGKLKPPLPALKRDVEELAKSVGVLNAFLREQGKEVVAIFDGLDRLGKVEQFWSVVEQDLRALRPLQISVLAAGPLSVMYGQGRVIQDYFDGVYYLPPAITNSANSPFLLDVLRLRGAGELMSEQQMRQLCLSSGGVLRDLISLARSTAESAYLNDADEVTTLDADKAVQQLGNSYLLGLGSRQVEILKSVVKGNGFSPADATSMELLITRRVLEQSGSRYEVHPALAPLL